MYKYITNRQPRKGDIVEFNKPGYTGSFTHGKLYVCKDLKGSTLMTERDDSGSRSNGNAASYFKIVKTSPSINAKKGDSVICIEDLDTTAKLGIVFDNIDQDSDKTHCYFTPHNCWNPQSFLWLHKSDQSTPKLTAEEQPMSKKTKKVLTDLQKALKKPFTVVIFNTNGAYIHTRYFKKAKKALAFRKEYLLNSLNLGSTLIIHNQKGNPLTTSIPLTEVK